MTDKSDKSQSNSVHVEIQKSVNQPFTPIYNLHLVQESLPYVAHYQTIVMSTVLAIQFVLGSSS